MGLCQSEEIKTLRERSKQIDREIKKTAMENAKSIKLLLLGTGDSGKSTLLKQMRILHNKGFAKDELKKQRIIIFQNTIEAMNSILQAMERYEIKFNDPARQADSAVIAEAIHKEPKSITNAIATAIKNLLQDPDIQKIYERRDNFHLQESAK